MTLMPDQRLRRSALYRELKALDATFAEVNGAACAMVCGGSAEAEAERARTLAICDLSPLPRAGFKGVGAIDWVRTQGVTVTDANNMTAWQDDGASAARLARVAKMSSASHPWALSTGSPNPAITSSIIAICGTRSSGIASRFALYPGYQSLRIPCPGESMAQ